MVAINRLDDGQEWASLFPHNIQKHKSVIFKIANTGLKVAGEVKKVGKSRNFHPKVGKSRNFSVLKVGKSRNFRNVFITSLHTGTSIMLVSFLDFEAKYLFSKKCTFYTKSVAIVQPYCVLLIANYCLRTKFRLNLAAFLAITCNVAG